MDMILHTSVSVASSSSFDFVSSMKRWCQSSHNDLNSCDMGLMDSWEDGRKKHFQTIFKSLAIVEM